MVPKFRRIVASRLKPQFASAWANVRALFHEPSRVLRLLAGSAATQLLMAAGLGVALRAVGAHVGFAVLVMICTFTALLGGMAPVPGGMGVMEACYISGLTLVGVPQDQAVGGSLALPHLHDLPPTGVGVDVPGLAPAQELPVNHDVGTSALAVVSACFVLWGLVSACLERWDVSALPIVFGGAGTCGHSWDRPCSSTSTCTR